MLKCKFQPVEMARESLESAGAGGDPTIIFIWTYLNALKGVKLVGKALRWLDCRMFTSGQLEVGEVTDPPIRELDRPFRSCMSHMNLWLELRSA